MHSPRLEFFEWVVGTVMAEWKSGRARACSAAEDLVPQADAEDRDAPDRLAGQFHGSVQHGRVAWPVGQDHTVRAGGLDITPGRGVGQDDDATAAFAKGAQDVALHAVI